MGNIEATKQRPTGVTIIAALNIIGGIIMVIIGIALAAAGAIIPGPPPEAFQPENLTPGDVDISAIPPSLIGGGLAAVSGVMRASENFFIIVLSCSLQCTVPPLVKYHRCKNRYE